MLGGSVWVRHLEVHRGRSSQWQMVPKIYFNQSSGDEHDTTEFFMTDIKIIRGMKSLEGELKTKMDISFSSRISILLILYR